MNPIIFVEAAVTQLRFPTNKGEATVEDLFRMTLKDLDTIALNVDSKLRASPGKSFLENPDPKISIEGDTNALRLEILKYVIAYKQEVNKDKAATASKRRQLEFLEGLRNQKKLKSLEDLDLESIEEQIRALQGDLG